MIEQGENIYYPNLEQQYRVHKEWFKGFIEGNIIWPQNNFGIHVLTLSAVLENQPQNWQEFERCELSDEQEVFLGQVMSKAHRQQGISFVTNEFYIESDRLVPRYRLQELWKATKAYVYADLLNFIDEDFTWEWNMTFSSPVTLNTYNTKRIQDFLNSDERSEKRRKLIKITTSAAEYLRSKEALHYASSYREEITQSKNAFSPKALEIGQQVKLKIAEFLSREYPNETFDWLLWGM